MRLVLSTLVFGSALFFGMVVPVIHDPGAGASVVAVAYAKKCPPSVCPPPPPPTCDVTLCPPLSSVPDCGLCEDSAKYQRALADYDVTSRQYLGQNSVATYTAWKNAREKLLTIIESIEAKAQKDADKLAEKCQQAQDRNDQKKIQKYCV